MRKPKDCAQPYPNPDCSHYRLVLRGLPMTEVRLDEMWSFIRRKHAPQAGPDGESTDRSEDGL